MNGWSAQESSKITAYTVGSWNGTACYCIEPGTPLAIGDVMTARDETYWDNYPSNYNKTISADEIKLFIGRIFQYGYTGTVSTSWRSQNADDADKMAHMMATQTLIWETVVGERDSNFNHVDPGSYDAVSDRISTDHPLYSQYISYYNSMVSNVQKHSKVPSFFAKSTAKAQEIDLEWNGTNYSVTLTDTNNVLGNFTFSADASGINFSVSGTDSKGKLKLPEIRKICIQKNANVNVDLVGELCKKILVTTAVEPCFSLKNELETLLLQEGETPENKMLVAQAKLHLDEGMRLRKIIYDKTASIQAAIVEIKKKFNIPAVIKALVSIPSLTQYIEDGRPFVYSDTYKQLVDNLRSEVKGILNQSYLLVIKKMKCEITQLSQYKSTYARYAKILRENGMEEYAVATEKRLQELETELLAKQHYESSLVECEKDLTLSGSVNKYRECEELRSKLSSWVTFFDNAKDLPMAVSGPLRAKIDEALAQLGDRIQKIAEEYQLTVSSVSDAKTVADLRRIDSKMEQFTQQQLPEDWTRNILILRDSIGKAIAFIEALPHDLDALVHAIAQISEEEHPHCIVAIRCCTEAAKSELERAEKSWVDKYITVAEQSYQTMTPHECTTWLERTKTLPECLGNESKRKYNRIKELIEHQLHAARVDGVLSMYDALTSKEKEEFKKLLARR